MQSKVALHLFGCPATKWCRDFWRIGFCQFLSMVEWSLERMDFIPIGRMHSQQLEVCPSKATLATYTFPLVICGCN